MMKDTSIRGLLLLLVIQVISFILLPYICFKLLGSLYLFVIICVVFAIVVVTSEDTDTILRVIKRIIGAVLIVVSSYIIMWVILSLTCCKLIFS